MPVIIADKLYYQTNEAAREAGISRSTLLRWIDKGIVNAACKRDRRGWRLFDQDDINTIKAEAQKLAF